MDGHKRKAAPRGIPRAACVVACGVAYANTNLIRKYQQIAKAKASRISAFIVHFMDSPALPKESFREILMDSFIASKCPDSYIITKPFGITVKGKLCQREVINNNFSVSRKL